MTNSNTREGTAQSVSQRDLGRETWLVRSTAGPVPAQIAGRAIPAIVPGVVHLDLLRAGLIPDPYLDDNESLLSWIGLTDWTYSCSFDISQSDIDAAAHHDLVFDGLDTVATITLNGEPLADVANQHRTYRFDVAPCLLPGENELVVSFRSPVKYANEQAVVLGARPGQYSFPYEAIRKSACSFGWDWGISTATSGIWRSVRLESWSVARIERTLVHAEVAGDGGYVEARVAVDTDAFTALELRVEVAGRSKSILIPPGSTEAICVVHLDTVERWWPTGHGEQPLYELVVQLRSDTAVLDTARRKVGFRTLAWNTVPDSDGTPFELVVNGRPIFVKGVNWIPDDAFFPRVDRERYSRRLTQAKAAHINLIRVWGGGMYESDGFFELCDELGLLTWQDFLFACAAYSEDEPIRSEIVLEARDNVARIAHHASLALLTGNNENIWGYDEWGWEAVLDGKSWGALYYDELLPQVVSTLAPHVPYSPGSPFSPGGGEPNSDTDGTVHLWDQWNARDWLTYREHTPRFVAEFGWQGPPTWATLTRAISDDPLTPDSPGMIVHQKAAAGNAKLREGLVRHYRVPDQMENWHWAMQLNQANAVTCALEWFRANAPLTSGAIVWQLNDCWPVTSWAAIDGDEREKPLYFALKSAYAPRLVSIVPSTPGPGAAGPLTVVATNDIGLPWEGELLLSRTGFDGRVLASASVDASIPAYGRLRIDIPEAVASPQDASSELVVAELVGVRGIWFFAEPRDSALTPAEVDVATRTVGDALEVTITAHNLIRELTLLVDGLGKVAQVDRALVTLLPGESTAFRISGIPQHEHEMVAQQVRESGVLRTANQLVAVAVS